MKYINWLLDKHFEIVVTSFGILVGVAIIATSAMSNSNDIDKQHDVAVDAGVFTASAEEIADEPEPQRTYFDVPLDRDVQDRIFAECEKHNISPAVIIAMIDRESDFNTYCLGDDGRSAGLMQIQAKWHLKRMIALDCTDLFNPCQNVTVGINILAELYNKYGCDYGKALTAYNQGSYKGTVTNYAKSILNNAKTLENGRGDV